METDLVVEDELAHAEMILDFMNVGLAPERNETCYCGSGKKYKKCCEAKKIDPIFASHPEFGITEDALTLLEAYGERLSDQDTDEFLTYVEIIDLEEPLNKRLFKGLEALAKKYKNPFVMHMLAQAYELAGDMEKSEEIEKNIETAYPDYIFSRVSRADDCEQDKDHLFPEIFNNCQCLTQLYPGRDVFHVSELWAFHETWLIYCCGIDDLLNAECHFQLLAVIGADDPDLADAEILIDQVRFLRRFKIAMNRLHRPSGA